MTLSDGIATANTLLVFATAVIALITFRLMRAEREAFIRSQEACVHATAVVLHDGHDPGGGTGRTIEIRLVNLGGRDAERMSLRYRVIPCDESCGGALDRPLLKRALASAVYQVPGALSPHRREGVTSRSAFVGDVKRGLLVIETVYRDAKTADELKSSDVWRLEGGPLREEERAEVIAALGPVIINEPQE